MGALVLLLSGVQIILGIASLVCFIMVVVKMFQNDATGVGIASLVLILCGIGGLIAFIYGWMKASAWNSQSLMLIWTGCILGSIVASLLVFMFSAAAGVEIEPAAPLEPNF